MKNLGLIKKNLIDLANDNEIIKLTKVIQSKDFNRNYFNKLNGTNQEIYLKNLEKTKIIYELYIKGISGNYDLPEYVGDILLTMFSNIKVEVKY